MKYNAKYFINKFEAIPEDKWAVCDYTDNNGKFCALGHCGSTSEEDTEESWALLDVFGSFPIGVAPLNDLSIKVTIYGELGDTPKERVLNALYLIDSGILEDV